MAKRFTDSEKWKDEWFDQLSVMGKLFFFYFTDNCDHAGILKASLRKFCKDVGAQYQQKDLVREFGDRVVFLDNGSMFMPKFIKFQYGELQEGNNAHRGVVKSLKYNGIEISPYLAPAEPLPSPCLGAQEKDKEQDKDKVKVKENVLSKESLRIAMTPDQVVQIWNEVLSGTHGYAHGLGAGKHLENFLVSVGFITTPEAWREYFSKIKASAFLSGESKRAWKPTLAWAVDYDNAIKILDGQYDNGTNDIPKSLQDWAKQKDEP